MKEFQSQVVRETAYGVIEDLGMQKQTMKLHHIESSYLIEWIVGEGVYEEIVEIGIWVKDKKVVEYDGVFELPKEAIQLLKDEGFDTSEVEIK